MTALFLFEEGHISLNRLREVLAEWLTGRREWGLEDMLADQAKRWDKVERSMNRRDAAESAVAAFREWFSPHRGESNPLGIGHDAILAAEAQVKNEGARALKEAGYVVEQGEYPGALVATVERAVTQAAGDAWVLALDTVEGFGGRETPADKEEFIRAMVALVRDRHDQTLREAADRAVRWLFNADTANSDEAISTGLRSAVLGGEKLLEASITPDSAPERVVDRGYRPDQVLEVWERYVEDAMYVAAGKAGGGK
jgi:hypothetical protein